MYAVTEIAGSQIMITTDKVVKVPFIDKEAGTQLEFDRVLLFSNEGDVKCGAPYISGAKVEATIVDQIRDPKVIVFKKKRRKDYRRKKGHKQRYSLIKISSITV